MQTGCKNIIPTMVYIQERAVTDSRGAYQPLHLFNMFKLISITTSFEFMYTFYRLEFIKASFKSLPLTPNKKSSHFMHADKSVNLIKATYSTSRLQINS